MNEFIQALSLAHKWRSNRFYLRKEVSFPLTVNNSVSKTFVVGVCVSSLKLGQLAYGARLRAPESTLGRNTKQVLSVSEIPWNETDDETLIPQNPEANHLAVSSTRY
jgi:hypothetical protein